MSTVAPWLDDAEIDWSAPCTASAVRARPRARRSRAAGLTRLLIVVLAAAAGTALALVDRDSGSTLPDAPPLRVPASAAADPPALTLGAVAHCESRGDPTAVSADGRYRGKYQFDLATWQSVGGRGDPAQASEREQDRRARALAAERGTAPWPVCGSARAG